MASIPAGLKTKAQNDPQCKVNLIVRVKDDPAKRSADLQSLGWTVQRTFSLTPSASIQGPAGAIPTLANQPWVVDIQEDKTVHTM